MAAQLGSAGTVLCSLAEPRAQCPQVEAASLRASVPRGPALQARLPTTSLASPRAPLGRPGRSQGQLSTQGSAAPSHLPVGGAARGWWHRDPPPPPPPLRCFKPGGVGVSRTVPVKSVTLLHTVLYGCAKCVFFQRDALAGGLWITAWRPSFFPGFISSFSSGRFSQGNINRLLQTISATQRNQAPSNPLPSSEIISPSAPCESFRMLSQALDRCGLPPSLRISAPRYLLIFRFEHYVQETGPRWSD